MLSPYIVNLLENKYGKKIRYPSDCENISREIADTLKESVSSNTLKRLLGFIKDGVQTPRLSTLDIIANYIGFDDWDVLLQYISEPIMSSAYVRRNEMIRSRTLKKGEKVRFEYSPERVVVVEHQEELVFTVVGSINSKLQIGDIVEVEIFLMNRPLYIYNVMRNNENIGDFIAGKISGITAMTVIKVE
ncbi:hypothetical protein M2459_001574 [Parabacteroides sp. PF5-5]|uniref:hypothetical protein n=1 Tax=Parabacteroides sp. PH5-26 TaxID=2940643 RepID=UPI0024759C98|nr:hypothetical protein [Parabacteroides sp. PH5-26]MDH6304836.1 hypothetical protein [Parabacteroides sp. PH5-39]MDH6316078.1 hypothetical protein [Parabacteroides sp. PF5-13]MDH6319735.1 hypothetical protein [Parabacteroides sp. PH5-13]MDH6323466.1 hypothetical protein [Parabacteroides sp. PH5-8]MDH6327026.1 hypothetical protein [Parabacteroides sp. PH5-41]MDH6334828.1 hypothetical protein [Parabacteroides sp. PF5-5]MDH6345892.1 hypothetical protein [Parabacteroides sp. PH5-46]MDH6361091.